MSEEKLLNGMKIVVTGGGRGIGRTIALGLAREGAAVGLLARTEKQLQEVKGEIEAMGGAAAIATADVTKWGEVEPAVKKLGGELGGIDMLVNNAGYAPARWLVKMDPSEFDQVIASNVNGGWYATKAAVPFLEKSKNARVLFTGSVMGHIGLPRFTAYCAAKAAQEGMARAMAEEFKSRLKVLVNCLCPSYVDTQALRGNAAGDGNAGPEVWAPTDLVPFYLFFASKASNRVTGKVVDLLDFDDVIKVLKQNPAGQTWKELDPILKEKAPKKAYETAKGNRKLVSFIAARLDQISRS